MFEISKFPKESDVSSYIGRAVSKKLGYTHLDGYTGKGMDEIQFLRMTSQGRNPLYLNLFVSSPDGHEWKVGVIGLIVSSDCLTELTNAESDKLWKFGTSYNYKNFFISMCDITGIDLDTICSYVSEDAAPAQIVVDKSYCARKKTISGIIQDWFELQDHIRCGKFKSEEERQYAASCNTRNQVVEKIAEYCRSANRCQKYHVAYQGEGGDVKIKISLLSADNSVYELYLQMDEVHVGLFYMLNDNNRWVKKLLPDCISDVSRLFKRKAA